MVRIQQYLNSVGYNLKLDGSIGPKTISAAKEHAMTLTDRQGFDPWSNKGWVMLYIRTDQVFSNKFDDIGMVVFNGEVKSVFTCSTTAGDFYVFNPLTVGGVTGVAVAAPQYVRDSHVFVTSRDWNTLWLKAPYFKQVRPIKIFRDGNKDRRIDKSVTQTGLFGINLHRAGAASVVNRWSAGCNVAPDAEWFGVIKQFYNGLTASYCLVEE